MVLVFLIMLTEAVNAFLPSLIQKETLDMSEFNEEIKAFEASLLLADTLEDRRLNTPLEKPKYPKQPAYKKKAIAGQPSVMIEINTADSAQLQTLYGIGPAFAGRILKYRGMLGGFFSPEQLLEVYGMDSSRYNGIKTNIKIDKSKIKKIQINSAEFKELLRHPYLDYETVKLICNFRDQKGPITCDSIMRKVIGYDPMWEKVRNYLRY